MHTACQAIIPSVLSMVAFTLAVIFQSWLFGVTWLQRLQTLHRFLLLSRTCNYTIHVEPFIHHQIPSFLSVIAFTEATRSQPWFFGATWLQTFHHSLLLLRIYSYTFHVIPFLHCAILSLLSMVSFAEAARSQSWSFSAMGLKTLNHSPLISQICNHMLHAIQFLHCTITSFMSVIAFTVAARSQSWFFGVAQLQALQHFPLLSRTWNWVLYALSFIYFKITSCLIMIAFTLAT